jgi:DNA repair ATPase RecN
MVISLATNSFIGEENRGHLSKYDEKFNEYDSELNSIAISLKNFLSLSKFFRYHDFNPLEIEPLRERYAELKKIIRQLVRLKCYRCSSYSLSGIGTHR